MIDIIRYRKDIDALRGISILLVVIYHAFPEILPGGFVGVDVFFVISGYLITNIIIVQIIKGEFSFIIFYQRRIRRLFPALLAVLLFSLIIGWLILFPDEYKQLGQHITNSTFFILNFALIKELGYFDVSRHYKPLLHLWTLSIEVQYYLVWPVILVLGHKYKLSSSKLLLPLILISFLANIYFVNDYKDEVFFHSVTRFWELGLGSLLAIFLYDNQRVSQVIRKIHSKYIFVLGLTLIICSALWINHDSFYPSWLGLFPTIGALLIILADLKLSNWGGLVKIGLISYPFYLWHWIIFSFTYIYIGRKPDIQTLIFAIIASLILSYLTNKYIEKVRHIESNMIPTGLILLAASIGIGGILITGNEGFSTRNQLSYLNKYDIEFKRTPRTDELCDSYVSTILQEDREFDYCRANINIQNQNKLVIIGDSHAHALFPGIADVANDHGYDTILLANSSCPPLVGFMWGRNPDEINNCQIRLNQILEILELDERINIVVFTTRGPVYIHGEIDGRFTETSVNDSLSEIKFDDRQTYETYSIGFEKTLLRLEKTEHIKKVFYFLENPELDFLPKEVIPRPYDYWGISISKSVVDRRLYRLRMGKYRDLIIEKSAIFPKVYVVDLEPYLCDGNECNIYKNGNFLYADDDHFSVFGSIYIAIKTEDLIFE